MTIQRIQTGLWGLFLIYYFATKYFVGGFTGFSIPYLFSVVVLVVATAILPFYISRWVANKLAKIPAIVAALISPILLTTVGLSLYFVLFIAPNYPNIALPNILHRAIEPGIAITVLILLPYIAEHLGNKDSDSSVPDDS